MDETLVIGGAAFAAWILVTVTVPLLARLCHRRGWLDSPGPRKIHLVPTPRLTGVSFFIAAWGTILAVGILFPEHVAELRPHFLPILAGSIIILALGVLDDLRPLRGTVKLAGQLLGGLPLWVTGIGFDQLWLPFVGGIDLGVLSFLVSMVWFLALVNAVNIIDGVDGLATATSGIAALALIWVTWILNLILLTVVAAGLFGALAGFWRFNKPPARVFMGDSGSLTLGYFFAVIALLAPIKRFTALAFFVPLIAMLLPLAESVVSVVRRSAAGANPMRADVGHMHHLLLSIGWSPRQVVAAYAIVSAVFGAFCVAFRYYNRRILAAVLGFFVLSLGVALGIILASRKAGRGDSWRARPEDER